MDCSVGLEVEGANHLHKPSCLLGSKQLCTSFSPLLPPFYLTSSGGHKQYTHLPTFFTSLHALAQSHNLPSIIDETHRDFLDPSYGVPHALFVPSSSSASSWKNTLVHLFSFSKSWTRFRYVRPAPFGSRLHPSYLFENLPKNWKIGAQGGYVAFVLHPFLRVRGEVPSKRLERNGGVSLPGEFFAVLLLRLWTALIPEMTGVRL
ncbi:hypothetical protein BDQ17DRAFT_204598 [Cyathus striatus]|nr:hypothetical protein BDQ17DRAFT_204598 [Cyathus striatus]